MSELKIPLTNEELTARVTRLEKTIWRLLFLLVTIGTVELAVGTMLLQFISKLGHH